MDICPLSNAWTSILVFRDAKSCCSKPNPEVIMRHTIVYKREKPGPVKLKTVRYIVTWDNNFFERICDAGLRKMQEIV